MLFLSFQSPHNGDDLSEGEGDVGSPDDEMAQKVRNIVKLRLGSGTQAQSGSNSGSVTQAQ